MLCAMLFNINTTRGRVLIDRAYIITEKKKITLKFQPGHPHPDYRKWKFLNTVLPVSWKYLFAKAWESFFEGRQIDQPLGGCIFFPFPFSRWTACITLGFNFSYKGAIRHPCTHSFPFVPDGYDSQMKTLILTISWNSPFPSFTTPLPARALN